MSIVADLWWFCSIKWSKQGGASIVVKAALSEVVRPRLWCNRVKTSLLSYKSIVERHTMLLLPEWSYGWKSRCGDFWPRKYSSCLNFVIYRIFPRVYMSRLWRLMNYFSSFGDRDCLLRTTERICSFSICSCSRRMQDLRYSVCSCLAAISR